MVYIEFKRASKKHLVTCEHLIEKLDVNCKVKEKYILTNIYYLSGYIFETILKFSIYSAVGYDRQKDIKKLNQCGLCYLDNIQIHSLVKLKRTIEANNISSIYNYDAHKTLFNAWNSEIRYLEKVDYEKDDIISFFKFAKQNYEILQQYK
ncbi:hypothetical protein [Arcobacter sp.]|uniref:hypothetical protein n=1 Tax=unclassified Arcobacter TaxID=2593671 RepID=UPI003AFFEA08